MVKNLEKLRPMVAVDVDSIRSQMMMPAQRDRLPVGRLPLDVAPADRVMRLRRGGLDDAPCVTNVARQHVDGGDVSWVFAFAVLFQTKGGLAAKVGGRELIWMTGQWTDLTSRVNIAAGSMEKGNAVMGRVSEMARRTYSDLTQTAEGYLALSTTLTELGVSTDQQLDFVESLNNALVVSGAKGQTAWATPAEQPCASHTGDHVLPCVLHRPIGQVRSVALGLSVAPRVLQFQRHAQPLLVRQLLRPQLQ